MKASSKIGIVVVVCAGVARLATLDAGEPIDKAGNPPVRTAQVLRGRVDYTPVSITGLPRQFANYEMAKFNSTPFYKPDAVPTQDAALRAVGFYLRDREMPSTGSTATVSKNGAGVRSWDQTHSLVVVGFHLQKTSFFETRLKARLEKAATGAHPANAGVFSRMEEVDPLLPDAEIYSRFVEDKEGNRKAYEEQMLVWRNLDGSVRSIAECVGGSYKVGNAACDFFFKAQTPRLESIVLVKAKWGQRASWQALKAKVETEMRKWPIEGAK